MEDFIVGTTIICAVLVYLYVRDKLVESHKTPFDKNLKFQ